MEHLAAGETAEPPPAPQPPVEQPGQQGGAPAPYGPPRRPLPPRQPMPPNQPMPPPGSAARAAAPGGVNRPRSSARSRWACSRRTPQVLIDGQRWDWPQSQPRLVVQLPARAITSIEITKEGLREVRRDDRHPNGPDVHAERQPEVRATRRAARAMSPPVPRRDAFAAAALSLSAARRPGRRPGARRRPGAGAVRAAARDERHSSSRPTEDHDDRPRHRRALRPVRRLVHWEPRAHWRRRLHADEWHDAIGA